MASTPDLKSLCCTATTWAKILASFQMIANFIPLIIIRVKLLSIEKDVESTIKVVWPYTTQIEYKEKSNQIREALLQGITYETILAIFGLFLSFILLLGVTKKIRGLLTIWISLTTIQGILILFNLTSGDTSGDKDGVEQLIQFIWILLITFGLIFGIWLVSLVKDQFKEGPPEKEEQIKLEPEPEPEPEKINEFINERCV